MQLMEGNTAEDVHSVGGVEFPSKNEGILPLSLGAESRDRLFRDAASLESASETSMG